MWVYLYVEVCIENYLWSSSFITLRIVKSPEALRTTAAFDTAAIFPITSVETYYSFSACMRVVV